VYGNVSDCVRKRVREGILVGGVGTEPQAVYGSSSPPAGGDSNCNMEPQLSLSQFDPNDPRQLLLHTCVQKKIADQMRIFINI